MPEVIRRSSIPARGAPAFSLIELIIVILIASLIAALAFSTISFNTKPKQMVGIFQLKSPKMSPQGDAQLVCLDHCHTCTLSVNGDAAPLPSTFPEVTAYALDESGSSQEIDFGRVHEKKVCLRFHFYANGSTSQMILASGETYYFIPSFFGKIETFDTLDGAVTRWRQYRDQLDSMGTFF